MTKLNKIIYWIATAWLALGMVSTGLVQLLKMDEEVARLAQLGYSDYVLTILGVWKMLGVVALLVPKFPLLKEWAYAGFFFAMSGAVCSHVARGSEASEYFGPVLLLVLILVSWYFRPADRKLIPTGVTAINEQINEFHESKS